MTIPYNGEPMGVAKTGHGIPKNDRVGQVAGNFFGGFSFVMLYLNNIPFRTLGRNEFSSVFQVEDFECLVQKCTWLPWRFGSSKIFWRHQMASNLGFHLIFVNWQLCEVCIAWLPENLSYYSSRWNDDGWYTYAINTVYNCQLVKILKKRFNFKEGIPQFHG